MDSGCEEKQNRGVVMTRKGIYISLFDFLLPILLSCMNCFILLCKLHSYDAYNMHLLFYCIVINYDDFTMHLFTLQQLLDSF